MGGIEGREGGREGQIKYNNVELPKSLPANQLLQDGT